MSDVAVSASDAMVRATTLVGGPVRDGTSGEEVGRVEDLVARLADDGYPPVTGVLAHVAEREVFVPVGRMQSMGADGVVLSSPEAALSEFERRAGEVLLRRDVVGRQVVYIDEHRRGRLVHASDIELTRRSGNWVVAGIDAGQRSRLPWRRSRSAQVVDWSHVEPFLSHVPTSRLGLRLRWLVQLHPGDVADLVEEASPDEADEIIRAVGEDRGFEADVFEELDQEHQLELVARRSDQQVAELLGNMAPDDAADLLGEIDRDRRQPILALMAPAAAQRLRNLLSYNPQSAGGMMSPGGICVEPSTPVGDALERIRQDRELPETFDTVLVVDEGGRLAAASRLLELLRSAPDQPIGAIAHPDPPRVRTGADLVEVTLVMTDYNLTTLAVVDDDDRVVGVVTSDDIMEQLVPENWRRRAEATDD